MTLDPEVVALLILVAAGAGFIDAIAGGGGLITLPSLVLAGLDPIEAIATNKLQGTFGGGAATRSFLKAGHIEPRDLLLPVLATLAGATLGALFVHRIEPNWLKAVIPLLLIAVSLMFAFGFRLKDAREPVSPLPARTLAVIGATVGFYDGFFGPGAGSFYVLGLTLVAKLPLLQATANTKALNFASNIAALAVFGLTGGINYALGFSMAAGQIAGATLGARAAMKSGARLIRPLVVTVSLAIAMKLLLDPGNPIYQLVPTDLH